MSSELLQFLAMILLIVVVAVVWVVVIFIPGRTMEGDHDDAHEDDRTD